MRRPTSATILAFTVAATFALTACEPRPSSSRRLWLNVPIDGVRVLQDLEPRPF